MQRRNCKKIGNSLLAWLLIFTMLAPQMLVNAEVTLNDEKRVEADETEIPPGRQWIEEDEIGTAIVMSEVSYDEDGEVVIGEAVDLESIPMPMATVGSNVTITPHAGTLSYGNWSTCKFTAASDNGSYMGYCVQPQTPTPSGVFTVAKIDGTTEWGKKLKIGLMFGENGPWYSESTALFGNCSWSTVYAYLHAMLSIVYSGQTNGLTAIQVQAMNGAINQQYAERGNLPDLNNYTVYVAYNSMQDIVWLERVPEVTNGYLTLKKTSANPTLTDESSCYSLEGAKYGVYSDVACTINIGTLTTNGSGDSNTLTLKAGTYYVKETKAPKGYALDSTVHTVTVSSGKTTTVNTKDIPQSDPVSVLLGKIDKETNQNKPQGSASLANAQFTIKYYDVQMATDPAQSGYTPVRTWVLKTNENGKTVLADSLKVSGDELYKLEGVPTLPLGTITIQETKAPEGYLINNEIFVRQITSDGNADRVETYNQPTIPEQSLNLDVVKTLKGTSTVIPGVVFTHTKPDGSTEDLSTDANGKVSFKGLTYGTHTIVEKSVPDGYTKNPGKLTFTVAKNNDLVVNANTSTDATGKMNFSIQANGCGLLTVEDVLQPYSLKLKKTNESEKMLDGAEFTLYSDVACTKAIETKSTVSDGTLTFSNLTVGTKYYIRETKAPQGYRIPVDANGNVHVYEIYTNSDPLSNLFEYYVDGTKYTETNGEYAITGTKADRVVNLKVINYTGIKMPETGTHTSLILFVLGIVCMVATLFEKGKIRWKQIRK